MAQPRRDDYDDVNDNNDNERDRDSEREKVLEGYVLHPYICPIHKGKPICSS